MVRILHISDRHGYFPTLPSSDLYDMIADTGDSLPNGPASERYLEAERQLRWVIQNKDNYINMIRDKPYIECHGNHDFTNKTATVLRSYGLDAHDCNDKIINLLGLNFFGIPNVPFNSGNWNYETVPTELYRIVQQATRRINDGLIDVLLAHCPPYGILDQVKPSDRRIGSMPLSSALQYGMTRYPRAVLSGHCHEDNGLIELTSSADSNLKTIVSNAAQGFRIIDI